MPGVAITSTLPTVGSTVGPTWANQLKAWCDEVEADLEAAIVPSEINVNSNFEYNGYRAIELGGVRFNSIGSASTGSTNTNLLEVVNGELYYVDGNGTSIKLTNSGGLNLSTTGGITGNYAGTIADVSYSTADKKYTFLDDTATQRPAGMDCGDILLREKGTIGNSVTIRSPASLGTSYAIELFNTGTGSATYVVAGVYSGGTITLTRTRNLAVDTIDTTGLGTFTTGAKFKAAGDGSTTLDWFQEEGTTSSGLGWTPVIVVGAGTITYNKRYAWVQRVGDWAHVFTSIGFQTDTTTAGTSIKITGLPFRAMGDSYITSAGESQGYIAALGLCAEFPKTTGIYGSITVGATIYPVSTMVMAAVFDEDDEIFFFDTSSNWDDTANNKNSYDGSTSFPSAATLTPDNAAQVALTSTRYYRLTFQMSYRVSST